MPDKATHVMRPRCELRARELADYMAASAQRKRTVLREAKYRPVARVLNHVEARTTIAAWLREGDGDIPGHPERHLARPAPAGIPLAEAEDRRQPPALHRLKHDGALEALAVRQRLTEGAHIGDPVRIVDELGPRLPRLLKHVQEAMAGQPFPATGRHRLLHDRLAIPFGIPGVVGGQISFEVDQREPLISDRSRNRNARTG